MFVDRKMMGTYLELGMLNRRPVPLWVWGVLASFCCSVGAIVLLVWRW